MNFKIKLSNDSKDKKGKSNENDTSTINAYNFSIKYETDIKGRKILRTENEDFIYNQRNKILPPLAIGDTIKIDGEREWRKVKKLPSEVISTEGRNSYVNNEDYFGNIVLTNNLQYRAGKNFIASSSVDNDDGVSIKLENINNTYGYKTAPKASVIPSDGLSGGGDIRIHSNDFGRLFDYEIVDKGKYYSNPTIVESRGYYVRRDRLIEVIIYPSVVNQGVDDLNYPGLNVIELDPPDGHNSNHFCPFLESFVNVFGYTNENGHDIKILPEGRYSLIFDYTKVDITTDINLDDLFYEVIFDYNINTYNVDYYSEIAINQFSNYNYAIDTYDLQYNTLNLHKYDLNPTVNFITKLDVGDIFIQSKFDYEIGTTYHIEKPILVEFDANLSVDAIILDQPYNYQESYNYDIRYNEISEYGAKLFNVLRKDNPNNLVIVGQAIGIPTNGVLRIGSEDIRYNDIEIGSAASRIIIEQRGYNRTKIQTHPEGSDVFIISEFIDDTYLFNYDFPYSTDIYEIKDYSRNYLLKFNNDYSTSLSFHQNINIKHDRKIENRFAFNTNLNTDLSFEYNLEIQSDDLIYERIIKGQSLNLNDPRTLNFTESFDTIDNVDLVNNVDKVGIREINRASISQFNVFRSINSNTLNRNSLTSSIISQLPPINRVIHGGSTSTFKVRSNITSSGSVLHFVYYDNFNNSRLARYDFESEQVVNVGTNIIASGINRIPIGLASDNDNLYIIRDYLSKINYTTGAAQRIGSSLNFGILDGDNFDNADSLAYHNNELYTIGDNRVLYTIDKTTGIASPVFTDTDTGVSIPIQGIESSFEIFGLTSHNNVLHGVVSDNQVQIPLPNTSNAFLIKINHLTNTAERIGTINLFGVNEDLPSSLASYNNKLIMYGRSNQILVEINSITGQGVILRSFDNLSGFVGIEAMTGHFITTDS